MPVLVTLEQRPRGRLPRWVVEVVDGSGLVRFSSRRVSIRFMDRDAAERFGYFVNRALDAGVLPSFPGLPRAGTIERLTWRPVGHDLDDDAVANLGDLTLRAEWLTGPARKGGMFHASAGNGNDVHVDATEDGVQLRSPAAARWWAELMARVSGLGSRGAQA